MDINQNLVDELVDAIISLQSREYEKEVYKNNIAFSKNGFVVSYNSTKNTADVQSADMTYKNIKNLTSTALTVGQKVKIFYNNKNLSDAYIGITF